MGARVPHRVRRGQPDDSVQGQVGATEADRATVGLFTYPVLQAADILLYQADQVPVGEDQRQHIELTRDLAQRFNTTFGETFIVPEPYILKQTAKILDLQTPDKQMSKSLGGSGCLYLLTTRRGQRQEDPVGGHRQRTRDGYDPEAKAGVSNLLTILATLTVARRRRSRRFRGRGYGDLKKEWARRSRPSSSPSSGGCASCSTPLTCWTRSWPTAPSGRGGLLNPRRRLRAGRFPAASGFPSA